MVSTLPLIFDWTNHYVLQAWVIFAIVFFRWLSIRGEKRKIRLEVTRLQALPVKIRWLPSRRGGGMHDTFYEVTLEFSSGKRVTAVCKSHPFDGLIWIEGPPASPT